MKWNCAWCWRISLLYIWYSSDNLPAGRKVDRYTCTSFMSKKGHDILENTTFYLFSTNQTHWHGDELQSRHNCPLLFVIVVKPLIISPHKSTLLAVLEERWFGGGGNGWLPCFLQQWTCEWEKGGSWDIVTPPPHSLPANSCSWWKGNVVSTQNTSSQWSQQGLATHQLKLILKGKAIIIMFYSK